MSDSSKVVDTFIHTQQILPTPLSQETMVSVGLIEPPISKTRLIPSTFPNNLEKENYYVNILEGWRLDCSTADDYSERPTAADGTLRRMLSLRLRHAGRRHQQPG